ncbi:MAG TPA: FlxA-like family protein, partial [Candidatus Saccharimonadales bacterium]|nr:FlxA-like family protein [Candidatus Saccharimonadales bacterium]
MKQRSTTPVSAHVLKRVAIASIAAIMVATFPFSLSPKVSSDKYDDQIRALQQEIDQYQAKAGELNKEILSLQEELRGIDNQKQVIQAQISLTEVKLAKLQEEIIKTEQQIKDNKTALGTTIADLYIDD